MALRAAAAVTVRLESVVASSGATTPGVAHQYAGQGRGGLLVDTLDMVRTKRICQSALCSNNSYILQLYVIFPTTDAEI